MSDVVLLEVEPATVPPAPDDPNRRYEWIDGEWVERKTGAQSSYVATTLIALLGTHVRAHQAGFVLGSDCGYKIFPHAPGRKRFPDVSFLRRGRLPDDRLPGGHVEVVPNLVVEVVSPNDLAENTEERLQDYLKAGVPLIWVLYPKARCARVLRQGGAALQLSANDSLHGEEILPGFSCRLADVLGEE
jgi:Uma2 family endonuclease